MNMLDAEFSRASSGSSADIMGADVPVNTLVAGGIEFVWGYPGGAVLYIYDAFYKQNKIEHILMRHEQATIHAADSYTRTTGRVGAALVTSGPGVASTATGIATAYLDSIPMVIITGSVPTRAISQSAFQEYDTVDITRPTVKHSFLVKDARSLTSIAKGTFYITATGRPGPVVVGVPKGVSYELCKYEYPKTIEMRSYSPISKRHSGQIRKAVSLLLQAKRPYIYSGGGIVLAKTGEELRQLVVLTGYPVTSTLVGLNAFPGTSKQFVSMLDTHDICGANVMMQDYNVLVAIDARFGDRVIGNPAHFTSQPRKIIHTGIDPPSISRRVKVDIPIIDNVKDVLQEMIAQIQSGEAKSSKTALAKQWGQTEQWRSIGCLEYDRTSEIIKLQYVVEKIWEPTHDDAFICPDVGQHRVWAAQFYKLSEPRHWINSGGLGTVGVDLPYAMGIKKAFPGREVVTITGKGSIQMCIQELSTCLQCDTPVKIYLLSNGYLGMVRQWREVEYDDRYSHSYMQALPDFVKLAESYGYVGIRVEKTPDVEPALHEAFRLKDRTAFLDFRTNPTENVWPMVQAGKGISGMLPGAEDL